MDEYYNDIAKGYDDLHKEEQQKKLAIIKQYLQPRKDQTLLDIGCGTGVSSDWECDVIAIDPNIGLLKQNQKTSIQASGENLPLNDNSFDFVVSITAIHNFNNTDQGLSEIHRVAKGPIALSILKRSKKLVKIEKKINELFIINKRIEEDKDIIFILNKCNKEISAI